MLNFLKVGSQRFPLQIFFGPKKNLDLVSPDRSSLAAEAHAYSTQRQPSLADACAQLRRAHSFPRARTTPSRARHFIRAQPSRAHGAHFENSGFRAQPSRAHGAHF